MKGKFGLVVGLGVGYVLGTRAGRQRYEQIKTQWLKLWHLDPVQHQVTKVQDYAKAQIAAVPSALWAGAVKVVKAAGSSGTPEQRLHAAADAAKDAAEDVSDASKEAAVEAKLTTAAKTVAEVKENAAPKTTRKSSAAAKPKSTKPKSTKPKE